MFSKFAWGVVGGLMACAVHATPLTSTIDPTDVPIAFGSTQANCPAGITCGPGSVTFTHDLRLNGFQIGDTLNSASLSLHLTDFITTGVNQEKFTYDFGGFMFGCTRGNCVPNSGRSDAFDLAAALDDIAQDGFLTVTVSSQYGSFLFADSVLTADFTHVEPIQPMLFADTLPTLQGATVPVPPTLALLGLGLLGMAVGSRKPRALVA